MLQLLLDSHIAPAVVAGVEVRRPHCAIISLRDWNRGQFRTAPDPEILLAAYAEKMTLVTYDLKTMRPMLRAWASAQRAHGGVILVDEKTVRPQDIGGQVRSLVALWDRHGSEDWTDRVLYLERAPTTG